MLIARETGNSLRLRGEGSSIREEILPLFSKRSSNDAKARCYDCANETAREKMITDINTVDYLIIALQRNNDGTASDQLIPNIIEINEISAKRQKRSGEKVKYILHSIILTY